MSIEFNFDELTGFSVEIDQSGGRLASNVRKAITISALKGKRAWSASASGRRYLGAYPSSIDFDIEGVGSGHRSGDISAELGPSLGRASAGLGIVEDSPGGVRGAPQRHYEKAEKVIEKDLVIGVLKAVNDSLGGL